MKIVPRCSALFWSRRILRGVLLLPAVFGPAVCQSAVSTWTRWEHSFTSDKSYANPATDARLKVNYRGPNQQTITGLGFWDGDHAFRIRCLFPAPGQWTWQTSCSDTNDAGLAQPHRLGRGGALLRLQSALPAWYLRVAESRRYLTHADGTPFLWIGDTPWSAPMNASMEDWQTYLRDRRDKGFTVLQVFCASDWAGTKDVEGNPPFLGAGLDQPNPAYWQQYEQKVQYANEQGLMVLIVGLMEPVKRYPDAGLRAAVRPASGRPADGQLRDLLAQLRQPVSRNWATWSARPFANPPPCISSPSIPAPTCPPPGDTTTSRMLDFCGLQTGAGWGGKPLGADIAARNAVEWSLELYRRQPTKPVVNLESRYDNEFNEKQMPRLPRSCGYWSFLSGCAGYTYGTAGLFNWGLTNTHNDPQASLWDWRIAMNRPSSTEMKHMAEFFRRMDWWRLEPHHDLILNQTNDATKRMVLAKSAPGDLAVAYLPDNPAITIEMSAFPAPMRWRWFNPKTGESQRGEGSASNTGEKTFERPAGWEDALLVLRQASTD